MRLPNKIIICNEGFSCNFYLFLHSAEDKSIFLQHNYNLSCVIPNEKISEGFIKGLIRGLSFSSCYKTFREIVLEKQYFIASLLTSCNILLTPINKCLSFQLLLRNQQNIFTKPTSKLIRWAIRIEKSLVTETDLTT